MTSEFDLLVGYGMILLGLILVIVSIIKLRSKVRNYFQMQKCGLMKKSCIDCTYTDCPVLHDTLKEVPKGKRY